MKTGVKEKVLQIIEEINVEDDFILDDIEKKQISYRAFWCQCLNAASLLSKKFRQKTIIALLENRYELLNLYFSVMLTDKKIIVIDPSKGKDEIDLILSEVQDSILIKEEYLDIFVDKDKFQKIAISELKNEQFHYLDEQGLEEIEMLIRERDFQAEYLVTYTSGTSGKSKGVVHSLENLFGTAFAMQEKVKAPVGIFMHVMPMTYMAGILNSIIFPFIIHNKIVIMRRFSVKIAAEFWNKVSEYKAGLFWLSPAMIMMIQKMDRTHLGEDYCKNNKVLFLIGTSHLTEGTREQCEKRCSVKLQASYGLSETLFISVETEKSIKQGKGNSVGELLDGVSYKILPDGELLLDVPWMYSGYINERDLDYFSGQYYKTGDLAKCQDGILFITGRKKELIIKGGMNISPVQIENCVSQCADITECAVFGLQDDTGEEIVCCAYAAKIDSDLEKEQIEEALTKKVMKELGKSFRIDKFIYIDRIPKNVNGKVDKKKLKSTFEEMFLQQEDL